MPKTNDNTGATAAGMTGIVEHGAPLNDGRRLSELDPELNLDGTFIDGEHPDHPAVTDDIKARQNADPNGIDFSATEPRPIADPANDDDAVRVDDSEQTSEETPKREEESSPGFNSAVSPKKTANSSAKSHGRGN